jgi:hypothetical protein
MVVPVREKGIAVARPDAVNIDAVNHRARCCIAPSTAQEFDGVTPSYETPEYLMEMELCATRLRVFTVLPIQYKNAH